MTNSKHETTSSETSEEDRKEEPQPQFTEVESVLPRFDEIALMLENGLTEIALNARAAGVQVPSQHSNTEHLVLRLSWRFPRAQMVLDEDDGISAVLTFDGEPFRCIVPWRAIFGARITASNEWRTWSIDADVDAKDPASADLPVGQIADPYAAPRTKVERKARHVTGPSWASPINRIALIAKIAIVVVVGLIAVALSALSRWSK